MNNPIPMRDGSVLPVFPLPNFVIFPGVVTRLHIFEKRYRRLFNDVLDRHGLFCISTLVGNWQEDYHSKTPHFNDVGCVCLVRDYERLDNGRYNGVVQAITRATLEEVPTDKPYREARVGILEIDTEAQPQPDQVDALRLLAESVLVSGGDVGEDQAKEIVGMEPVPLITTMSYYCPAPVESRLELLEATSYADMAPVLVDLYMQEFTRNSQPG